MVTLYLQEEEMLAEKVKDFPVLYHKIVKGFKEEDADQNTWEKVAESLCFAESGNFIRASSNWEYFEDSCSEKIGVLSCVRNSYKILANQFDLRRSHFGFRYMDNSKQLFPITSKV